MGETFCGGSVTVLEFSIGEPIKSAGFISLCRGAQNTSVAVWDRETHQQDRRLQMEPTTEKLDYPVASR
jgi:hypothetical protein